MIHMLLDLAIKEVECPEPVEWQFYVYLLLCNNKSLYCGSTTNLKRRLQEHTSGEGALWTKLHKPIKLVYYENHDTLINVRLRETQIKGWTVIKKLNLIRGVWTKQ